MNEIDINKKIEQQGELLQKLVEQQTKTQKALSWLKVIGIIRIVVIVLPIILSIIYLPSFIRNIVGEYKNVLPNFENLQESMTP